MSAWMLYAIGVALLMCVLALAAERLALAFGVGARWPWLAALTTSVTLPFLAPRMSALHGGESSIGSIRVIGSEMPLLSAIEASTTGAPWYEAVLLSGWMAASATMLALFVGSMIFLERRRRSWPRQVVAGAAVLISERTGPALIGFFAPATVIPRWMIEWDEDRLRLLFAHEREHQEAGDPLLLLAAIGALILMPWNLPLWWQVRRLRQAIEIDCDSRVLRRHHQPHAYGLLLLEVGERVARSAVPAAAFSEPHSFLERRIEALGRRQLLSRGVALALFGLAVAAPMVVYALPVPESPRLAALLSDGATAADVDGARAHRSGDAAAGTGAKTVPDVPPAGITEAAAAGTGAGTEPHVPPASVAEAAAADSAFSESEERERIAIWTRPATSRVASPRLADTIPDEPGDPRSTPYDVEPSLQNRTEFAAEMLRAYPAMLKDAGIGGTTVLWLFLTSDGAVGDTRIARSSGYVQLDHAAQAVVRSARFTPARYEGEAVPVWIQIPVTFSAKR